MSMRSAARPAAAAYDDEDSGLRRFVRRNLMALLGLGLLAAVVAVGLSLGTWTVEDPSLSNAVDRSATNLLGYPGAILADLLMQFVGIAAPLLLLPPAVWGLRLVRGLPLRIGRWSVPAWLGSAALAATAAATLPAPSTWPLPTGLGGVGGDLLLQLPGVLLGGMPGWIGVLAGLAFALLAVLLVLAATGATLWRRSTAEKDAAPAPARAAAASRRASRMPEPDDDDDYEEDDGGGRMAAFLGHVTHTAYSLRALFRRATLAGGRIAQRLSGDREAPAPDRRSRVEPGFGDRPRRDLAEPEDDLGYDDEGAFAAALYGEDEDDAPPPAPAPRAARKARPAPVAAAAPASRKGRKGRAGADAPFELPTLDYLVMPRQDRRTPAMSADALEENARLLESVLDDFGVRGEIIHVRPGPVVTLYELEPAPGIKSSRVIGLADDIARSMSAIACRVAVIPGKNAIGIELPNPRRETVYLSELLVADDFTDTKARLPLCLGKTIGGEPVVADLARMPHLLVAGTTGSGKSVSINTMILSLLYRLTPAECRLIMIDPKMLELSIYDGIPHLLTPVVTDPKKAVVALKWTVREMEDRYRKMSKVGVRNIDGLNARIAQAKAKGETLSRTIQTGFDPDTGEPIVEREELALEPMPYIVVIIDEMADLMMVAGKDIEGAVQRLAQMARAAGIHVVMATQRPSVDVITGTIKANFPTRISFQVTSKIDSRTILGEQGAEQLLGQGDMLYMMGGGRITRVHGPFVSDDEVEKIVAHLKTQGMPEYLEAITEDDGEEIGGGDGGDSGGEGGESNDLYDQAVAVVLRDRKASTSYVQRRLQIGYNRAASLIERMEKEGVVGPANHAGKREILVEREEERF